MCWKALIIQLAISLCLFLRKALWDSYWKQIYYSGNSWGNGNIAHVKRMFCNIWIILLTSYCNLHNSIGSRDTYSLCWLSLMPAIMWTGSKRHFNENKLCIWRHDIVEMQLLALSWWFRVWPSVCFFLSLHSFATKWSRDSLVVALKFILSANPSKNKYIIPETNINLMHFGITEHSLLHDNSSSWIRKWKRPEYL